MTTDNYILLIANTYLENGEKIGYGIETVKIRKELFQQQLIRVQNVEERDNFVTKKEFLNHCLIALHLLKEYVSIEGYIQINYLHSYLKDIKDGKYENEYFSPDNYPVNWKAEEERIMYEIDHFDIDEYLVAMDKLTNGIYKKLCNIDIEFIEEIFNNFSFEIDQPQQPEPNNPKVEKPSFINEFDNVSESKVIEYFTKNLVENRYLTDKTLTAYLKQAFELKMPPNQKFSFEKLDTHAKIRKVFYEYFKITAGKPSGRKREYVELLGDYFTGFNTDKLMTNFSK